MNNRSSSTKPASITMPGPNYPQNVQDVAKASAFSSIPSNVNTGAGPATAYAPLEQSTEQNVFKFAEKRLSNSREPLKKRPVTLLSDDKPSEKQRLTEPHGISQPSGVGQPKDDRLDNNPIVSQLSHPYYVAGASYPGLAVSHSTFPSVANAPGDAVNLQGTQHVASMVPAQMVPQTNAALKNNDDVNKVPPAASTSASKKVAKPAKKRSWTKPKDKPKRPLSAYNLFFKRERERILKEQPDGNAGAPESNNDSFGGGTAKKRRHRKSHGKIGFAQLARHISERWNNIDAAEKSPFEAEAAIEKKRYQKELEIWKKAQRQKKVQEDAHEAAALDLLNLKSSFTTKCYHSSTNESITKKSWDDKRA